jgi:hypothetical protein
VYMAKHVSYVNHVVMFLMINLCPSMIVLFSPYSLDYFVLVLCVYEST